MFDRELPVCTERFCGIPEFCDRPLTHTLYFRFQLFELAQLLAQSEIVSSEWF